MKKSLLLFSFLFVFIVGCQQNSSIVEPNQQVDGTSLSKSNSTYTTNSYWIDGSVGGKIKVNYSWGKNSKLKAVLDIPANAFSGNEEFYMTFNLDQNSVDLHPSPKQFDKPLLFSLKLKNVKVDYADLDFKYLDGNESVVYESNVVDEANGNLEVKKAQLHHFSDWGWER
jgi:hypothetical protein